MSLLPHDHRKMVRHYDAPGHAHELTFSCYRRLPLLNDDGRRRLLSQSIDRATESQGFRLIAFVYMPEHLHLIVFPTSEVERIESLLYAIKRPFSYRVKRIMQETNDPLLGRLTIQERPGKMAFRFWQEGPGYDRNITSEAALETAVEYIHNNPVRRTLCGSACDWKWSSWKAYNGGGFDPDLPRVHTSLA